MDVPQKSKGLATDAAGATALEADSATMKPGLSQVRDVVCPECSSYLGPVTHRRCCPECGAALVGVGASGSSWVWLDGLRRRLLQRRHQAMAWLRHAGLDLPLAAAFIAGLAGTLMVTVHELTRDCLASMLLNPLIEEALKVAFLVAVVETRPTRITRVRDLALVAMIGALAYSTARNAMELILFRPEWSEEVALPLVANVVLHMGCTAVATLGVIWAWRTMRAGQPGTRWALAAALPTLILAAIIRQVGISAGMLGMFH
jgi:hypothetical protein